MACCRSRKKVSWRSRSWVMSLTVHSAVWPCAGPSSGRTRMRRHAASPWPLSGGASRSSSVATRARARRLRQPVDRLRGLRRMGEQPLDVRRFAAARAGEPAVGVVGVEHARGAGGDDEAFLAGLGDGAREVELAGAADEAGEAGRIHEDRERAEDRQRGDGEMHRLAAELARREHQRRGRDDDGDQHAPRPTAAAPPVQAPWRAASWTRTS